MFNITEYLFSPKKNNQYQSRLIVDLKNYKPIPLFKSSFFATGTGGNLQTYLVPKSDIINTFNLSFLWLKDSDQEFEDLDSCFNKEWFQKNSFNTPEMIFNSDYNLIEISQGRHRMTILLRFLNEIPISIEDNKVPFNKISTHWKKIKKNDFVYLPNLPIVTY